MQINGAIGLLMFQNQTRYFVASLAVFTGIIFIETGITSLITQSLPNQFQFTVIENFNFYSNLFYINPAAALRLVLIENPVFVIQNFDGQASTQIWGIYFMPISLITLYMLSIFIVFIKKQEPSFNTGVWLCLASIILLFAVFYFRIESCCTSHPSWLLNVWLLSKVYNPLLDSIFWQDIYVLLSPWLPLMQFFMAAVSLLILFICYRLNAADSK